MANIKPKSTTTTSTPTHNGSGAPNKNKSKIHCRQLCPSQPLDDTRFLNPPSKLDNSSDSATTEAGACTDTGATAVLLRPISAERKRIHARRASPPITRSMTKANSMALATTALSATAEPTCLTRDSSITSALPASPATCSSTPVTMTPAVSQGSQTLVSTRPPTHAGSTITRTTSTAGNQNTRRVRQAVKLLEEKMQADSTISSQALVVRAKRPRAQDNDSNGTHQTFKHSRIQVHEEAPKRHMRPIVSKVSESRTISFQVPAGMDPTLPSGFSGHFDIPLQGQVIQTIATSLGVAQQPLEHTTTSRARSGSGCNINPVGQNHGQDTATATISICAETLLRHLTPPTRQESSTRKARAPTSNINTSQIALPAITLSLPTNSLRPSCNNGKGKDDSEKVQVNLTYHIDQQPPQQQQGKDQGQRQLNPHAILNSIDVEEVLSSEVRSSSAPASSSSSSPLTVVSQLVSRTRRTRSHPK